jgi:hypothetical protein
VSTLDAQLKIKNNLAVNNINCINFEPNEEMKHNMNSDILYGNGFDARDDSDDDCGDNFCDNDDTDSE